MQNMGSLKIKVNHVLSKCTYFKQGAVSNATVQHFDFILAQYNL